MPAQLDATPRISGPPDTAGSYLKGFGQGAQVAEANARIAQAQQQLAAQQQQAAMEAQVKQDQIAQNSRIEQQKAEIAREYNQSRIRLNQEKVAQAKQINDQRAVMVARQMQEEAAYQKDIAPADKGGGGMSPFEAMSRHPGMIPNMSGFASSVSRQRNAQVPGSVQAQSVLDPISKAPIPGVFAAPGVSGGMGIHNQPGFMPKDVNRSAQVAYLKQQLKNREDKLQDRSVQAGLREKDPDALAIKQEAEEIKRQLTDLIGLSSSSSKTITHRYVDGKFVPIGK